MVTRVKYDYPMKGTCIRAGVGWSCTMPPPRNYTVTYPARTLFSESVTSVNSPGFYVKKIFYVQWKPKKFPMQPPTVPRFDPPPLPKKPVRRKGSSEVSYRRILRIYEKRLLQIELKRSVYVRKYYERVTKFEKRLAYYEQQLSWINSGKPRFKRIQTQRRDLVNNPYSRSRTYDLGFTVVGELLDVVTILDVPVCPPTYGVGKRTFQEWADKGWLGHTYMSHLAYDSAPVLAALNAKAVGNLYEKLNKQSIHIAQVVAERAQTFGLLSDIIKRTAAVISGKRKLGRIAGDLFSGKGLKGVSNDYLAFQFGVKPLLSDVYGAAETLARLNLNQQKDKVVVRSRVTQKDHKSETYYEPVTGRTDVRDVWCEMTLSYVLEYSVENGASSELQKLGLLNPAEVAWELLPWSFVVDWFLPVGDYITSLSADAGLSFTTGTKTITTKTTYQTRRDYSGKRFNSYNMEYATGSVIGSKVVETKVRTVLTTPPVPRLPSFKNPLSGTHIAEAIALLVQRAKR